MNNNRLIRILESWIRENDRLLNRNSRLARESEDPDDEEHYLIKADICKGQSKAYNKMMRLLKDEI